MLVPTHAASAATRTWTGASSSAWSDGGNWVGGTPPVAGDDLVFPGGAPGSVTNDFPAGTSFQSLSFTGTTGTYTLSGNPIVLGAGTSATPSGSAGATTEGEPESAKVRPSPATTISAKATSQPPKPSPSGEVSLRPLMSTGP